MRCFVLGNGRSRLNVRLTELKKFGKIYGCNALYREFDPDYLIAVDPKMIIEINKAGYQRTHEVWTNANAKYKTFTGFRYFQPSLGWSSGPTALHLASSHNPSEVFILGFDYVGEQGKFNNVYADSFNYKKSSDTATYHGNWQRQTEHVIKTNKNIKFYRVIESNNFYDPGWNYPNFRHISYDELQRLMKTWPEKA